MRVVMDTNVLVSALLFGGKPSQIVEFVKEGKIELFIPPWKPKRRLWLRET